MLVTAFNPSTDDLEQTFIAQSYALGQSTIEVKNNQAFSNNARILIGQLGLSQSEIVTSGTPNANGTTLPIGSTLYSHPANTPVYVLQFDQVKFYRSINGIGGIYTLLAGTPIPIDVTNDNVTTSFDDTSAVSGYYYKVSMYNSKSMTESAQSDPIPAITGFARNQVGYIIDKILRDLNDPTEENVTRDEILGYMNEVNDDLIINVSVPYKWLKTRQVFARIAASNYIKYPTDSSGNSLMWKFDHIDYNFVDNTTTPVTNDTYTVEVSPSLTYFRNRWTTNRNDNTTQNDKVQEVVLNDTMQEFDYYPYSLTSSNAVWYLYFWSKLIDLTTEGQTIQTPTPRIYVQYVKYQYFLKRSVTEPTYLQMSTQYYKEYISERSRLKSHDRTDVGTPRRIESEGWVRKSYRR